MVPPKPENASSGQERARKGHQCSRCPNPRRSASQRLCRTCHAENMRKWRAKEAQEWKAAKDLVAALVPSETSKSARARPSGLWLRVKR